ncbi:MAG: hypothetical protein ABEH80_03740, partial [Halobaculum sp.]
MTLRVNVFDAAAGEVISGDDVGPGDPETARRDFREGVLVFYDGTPAGGEIRCILAAERDGTRRPVVAQGRWDHDGSAGVREPAWANFAEFVASELETAGWSLVDDSLTSNVFRKLNNRLLDPVASGDSSVDPPLGRDRPVHVQTPSTPAAVAVLNHLSREREGEDLSVVVCESVPPHLRDTVDVFVTSDETIQSPTVEPLGDSSGGGGASSTERGAVDSRSRGADRRAVGRRRDSVERGAPRRSGRDDSRSGETPTDGGGQTTPAGDFDLDDLPGGDPFDGIDDEPSAEGRGESSTEGRGESSRQGRDRSTGRDRDESSPPQSRDSSTRSSRESPVRDRRGPPVRDRRDRPAEGRRRPS